MRELGAPGVAGTAGAPQTEEERKRAETLAAAWEAMLVEGMDGATAQGAGGASGPGAGKVAQDAGAEDAFQKTIRETMSRMQDSEASLRVSHHAHISPSSPLFPRRVTSRTLLTSTC
jgi:hypothetical protein